MLLGNRGSAWQNPARVLPIADGGQPAEWSRGSGVDSSRIGDTIAGQSPRRSPVERNGSAPDLVGLCLVDDHGEVCSGNLDRMGMRDLKGRSPRPWPAERSTAYPVSFEVRHARSPGDLRCLMTVRRSSARYVSRS